MTSAVAGGSQEQVPPAAARLARRLHSGIRGWLPAACGALWLAWAAHARADVIDLSASKDATLYAEDGMLADGAGDHFFAGLNAVGQERRALLAFDVAAAIPAGSTIQSAQLVLYMSRTSGGSADVSIHRATADWGEAGSHASGEEGGGAPAQPGDATWTHCLYDTVAWASAGGDFDATALATLTVAGIGSYSFGSSGLTADVQAWLDAPGSHHGWLLISAGSASARRFDSRTHATSAQRPKLVVTFAPPSAVGACCSPDGSCAAVLDVDAATACSAGSYQGAATSCNPNPCPPPTGACCLPDAVGSCVEVDESACAGQIGSFEGVASLCADVTCSAKLTPFVDPLPLPKVAQPVSGSMGGAADYGLAMRAMSVKLHRDLPATTLWGIDDGSGPSFPGPTVEAFEDAPVRVTWSNDLRDLGSGALLTAHALPVDTCVHGATLGPPRTIIHLHGGHVPARFDGYPDDAFPPGEQAVYDYPNAQPAATLYYHDHALGLTRLNVYMGLTGLYVVRDADEAALDLPVGAHEIPLVIQDRSFRGDGSLIYPAEFHEHFFGDTLLVNGKVWPYLDVARGKYRFRVLNASNGRTLRLALEDGASFWVIGTDGGLLPAPVSVDQLLLGPAERAEIVVDFEAYAPGTKLGLVNDAPAPFPGTPGEGVVRDVLQFVVGNAMGHTAALPGVLATLPAVDEASAVLTRDLLLRAGPNDGCAERSWLINGMHWDDITEYPALGTSEIWRFVNASGVSHPMHMHLVQFRILDRQPVSVLDDTVTPLGAALPPAPEEAGWKDTVNVLPGEAVRVIAAFADYTGNFAYHCHILEHEDHDMMRQFVTVTSCGDGVRGEPDEACDDGAESATCDADCTLPACGDGVVNARAGELCDDGTGTTPTDCTTECSVDAGVAVDSGATGEEDAAVAAADAATTPGDASDGAADGGARGAHSTDGCGCHVGPGTPHGAGPWAAVLCTLALPVARRRRATSRRS